MGQTTSVYCGPSGGLTQFRNASLSVDHHRPSNSSLPDVVSLDQQRDHTSDIPDECLALIFQFLRVGDRKRCSLVCRRWFAVEGQSRHRLALNGCNEVSVHLPAIFNRFDSVTKLALRCDRKSVSLNDDALKLISLRCPNLTSLKIRGCREISDLGMSALAQNCKSLRKFSCGSCMFGARGMNALLNNCSSLEALTVKRLRGINDGFAVEPIGPGAAASSLKSITLKELYNGQCFGSLIIESKNLNSLKILRCLGSWDGILEEIAEKDNCLSEIHLERLQVSDAGLMAISKCPNLETFHLVKAPDCSDQGISAIAQKCRLLRKLHIDGWRTNKIGDEGLVAIAKNSFNLVELVLIGVNPSFVSLSEIASKCQKLERLALCGSETIGDGEISRIAAKCTALKKLCIKSIRVTDSGIEMFAFGCPNLVKLKIKKCKGVSKEAARQLRATRATLDVNLDTDMVVESEGAIEPLTSNGAAQDDGMNLRLLDGRAATDAHGDVTGANAVAPSTSNGARSSSRRRCSCCPGRTLVACGFQSSSNGISGSGSNDSL